MVRLACAGVLLLILTACGGSQGTTAVPGAPNVLSGFLRVTFHVAGRLDFAKYRYVVVFNTTGNELTPEAGHKVDWNAYSAAVELAEAGGALQAEAIQYLKSQDPHAPPVAVRLSVTPSELRVVRNGDGRETAFELTFRRSIFAAHSVSLANDWQFNAFVLAPSGVVDSMGRCDACFTSPTLTVNAPFDLSVAAKPRSSVPAPARILDLAFTNNP
jgi:hypothetical protein